MIPEQGTNSAFAAAALPAVFLLSPLDLPMTLSQTAKLTLIDADSESHPTPDLPGEPSQSPGRSGAPTPDLPDPVEMVRWRKEADARSEGLLAEFDSAIARGDDAAVSAHTLLHGFMRWTRKSIRTFDVATCSPVDRNACTSERAVWTGIADLVAQTAGIEPSGVDRFVRIWLAVVHEATATGQAWLYAR